MQAYIFKRVLKMCYNIKADEALEYTKPKDKTPESCETAKFSSGRQSTARSSSANVIDIAAATLSDLEEEHESDECDDL